MSEVQKLQGHEAWSNAPVHTQVYLATHDGADKRLPLRERSFISFTYGGKHIEDFNLIATVKGDRMERQLYGDFSDNTSTYDVLDGQFYWGSHFTSNKLELQLSTDEMTEQELQDFKSWFRPGEGKELILAEYPNRAIHARMNKVPSYRMLPFEKKVRKKFNMVEYEISTTVYRGEIDIEFVMDDPFWYSIYNVLPSYGQDGADDWFRTLGIDANENNPAAKNSLMANKDYLKIILEDGVPTKEMFEQNDKIITGDTVHNVSEVPRVGGEGYDGIVARVGVRLRSSSLFLTSSTLGTASAYLYYTGSAPAPTIMSFDLTPTITDGYVSEPWNKIYNKVAANSNGEPMPADYNKIIVGQQEFKFTTPSLYTGYNQAMDIITTVPTGTSTIDLHILLNEGVNEYYSRSWALGILNYIKAFQLGVDLSTSQINDKAKFDEQFKIMMRKFLEITDKENTEDPDDPVYKIMPASFQFNSKTGVSTGKFMIRKFTQEGLDKWDELSRYKGEWNVRIQVKEEWLQQAETKQGVAALPVEPDYRLEVLSKDIVNTSIATMATAIDTDHDQCARITYEKQRVNDQISIVCELEFIQSQDANDKQKTYQWQVYSSDNWEDIQNATGDTYTITNIPENINNRYRCIITFLENQIQIYKQSNVVVLKENPISTHKTEGEIDYAWLLYNAGFDMLDKDGKYLFSVKPFMSYTEEYEVTENVGDMVYSKYLYLNEKNLYDDNGKIGPSLKGTCTPISTNYPKTLQNFDIQYKHMYL